MTSMSAKIEFEDRDHGQAVVAVITTRCFYRVAITPGDVTIIGPGIEKQYNEEIPEGLTYKGQALIAVTLLEEEE